jgi:hypothetical protein
MMQKSGSNGNRRSKKMGGPGSGRRKRIEGITTPKYPACEKTSSYTPIKQKKFEAILKTHLWIVRNIQRQPKFKNFGKEGFAYFDLMAGPGKCPKFEGSPLIALRCLKEILGTADIGYEVVFIEEDKPSYYELCKNVKEAYPKLEGVIGSETTEYTSESFCVTIERGRWEETLPEYKVLESKKMHLALIYLDPAGTRPTWQLIQDLTKREDYKTVDWLIDCPAAKEKRRGGLLKNPKFNFNVSGGKSPSERWEMRAALIQHKPL